MTETPTPLPGARAREHIAAVARLIVEHVPAEQRAWAVVAANHALNDEIRRLVGEGS